MLDFPSNPAHNQKLTSGIIEFWWDGNMPSWQRAPVTSLPPIALTALSPTFALVNAPDFLLTATGTSFEADCVIQVNGADRATNFVSATSLTTTMSAAGAPGESQVTVRSPSKGKVTSAIPFKWAAVITLASISPTEAVTGDPDFLLTITGAGFVADCVIQIDGVAMATTFVNATTLTTTIATAAIATAGVWAVTVNSPSSAQTTAPQTFTWRLSPVLTSIAPATAARASVTVNLVVTGQNFSTVAGEVTVIYQGTKALPATVVASATSCSATIVAPTLAQTEEITVRNGTIATRSPPQMFTWT